MQPFKTPSWEKLPHDMCSCDACGWSGPTASLVLVTDGSDGWEYPTSHYHICPVCTLGNEEGDISSYWSSIGMVFEDARLEVQPDAATIQLKE